MKLCKHCRKEQCPGTCDEFTTEEPLGTEVEETVAEREAKRREAAALEAARLRIRPLDGRSLTRVADSLEWNLFALREAPEAEAARELIRAALAELARLQKALP